MKQSNNPELIDEDSYFSKCFEDVEMNDSNKENYIPNLQSSASQSTNQSQQLCTINLDDIPSDVFVTILTFLSPCEIQHLIRPLSCYFNENFYQSPVFWKHIFKLQNTVTLDRFTLLDCLVQRRSKGKIFKCCLRDQPKQYYTMRIIDLELCNAGKDDGVPTSLLRDVALSQTLYKRIHFCRVKQSQQTWPDEKSYYDHSTKLLIIQPYEQYNLKEYCRSRSVDVRKIVFDILVALKHCHLSGIMHRNLKPDNILLNDGGEVFLTDFTSSRVFSQHIELTPEDPKERERSGREAKRLWYKAPELLYRNKKYGFESDIWQVGCLLTEIALGYQIFNGSTEIENLFKIFKFTGRPHQDLMDQILNQENSVCLPGWQRVPFKFIIGTDYEQKVIYKAYLPHRQDQLIILKELAQKIGSDGLDLVYKLLEIDPKKRISLNDALAHPFFNNQSLVIDKCHSNFLNSIEQKIDINKFNEQDLITSQMRVVLLDWLIDVGVHFQLQFKTYQQTIQLLDRYIIHTIETGQKLIRKSYLQLVGVSCIKIFDNFSEQSREYYRLENGKEYSAITANEYDEHEVINMEKTILNALEFDLYMPTLCDFIDIYQSDNNRLFSYFLADLVMFSMDTYKYPKSLMAKAIVLVAEKVHKGSIKSKFQSSEVRQCLEHLVNYWSFFVNSREMKRFDAIYIKYSQLENLKNFKPPIDLLEQIMREIQQ